MYEENKYRPLSPWAYFGYALLFCLPVAGLVLLIVFSFSDKNINLRNYARSFFCALLILAIIAIVIAILILTGVLKTAVIKDVFSSFFTFFEKILKKVFTFQKSSVIILS